MDVSGLTAVGYGESRPTADNDTEAGREANRRIEFTLVGDGRGGKAAAPQDPAAGASAETTAATTAAMAEGPDFSADSSPSVAPQAKTMRPKRRPGATD